jgi:hypothetical protein
MSDRPEPTGVRFVLSNCAEPGREAELDEWYDAYAADCTRPGLLVNALRYVDRDAAGTDEQPRYAAVYDIVVPDVERAWPETKDHPSREFHSSSPLLSVALRASYRRIEPVFPVGSAPLPQAITIVLGDDAGEGIAEFMLHVVAKGLATRATRYELVEGSPSPPRYLELYEWDGPDAPSLPLSDRPAAATRLVGSYTRTFAHP